jgi:hypothetical protein
VNRFLNEINAEALELIEGFYLTGSIALNDLLAWTQRFVPGFIKRGVLSVYDICTTYLLWVGSHQRAMWGAMLSMCLLAAGIGSSGKLWIGSGRDAKYPNPFASAELLALCPERVIWFSRLPSRASFPVVRLTERKLEPHSRQDRLNYLPLTVE